MIRGCTFQGAEVPNTTKPSHVKWSIWKKQESEDFDVAIKALAWGENQTNKSAIISIHTALKEIKALLIMCVIVVPRYENFHTTIITISWDSYHDNHDYIE